jgi:hypothetical protein
MSLTSILYYDNDACDGHTVHVTFHYCTVISVWYVMCEMDSPTKIEVKNTDGIKRRRKKRQMGQKVNLKNVEW